MKSVTVDGIVVEWRVEASIFLANCPEFPRLSEFVYSAYHAFDKANYKRSRLREEILSKITEAEKTLAKDFFK